MAPKLKSEVVKTGKGRGSKDKYSEKQKRQAEHIYDSCRERGFPDDRSKQISWATVNKIYGGGLKGGSGSPSKTDYKRPKREPSSIAQENASKKRAVKQERSKVKKEPEEEEEAEDEPRPKRAKAKPKPKTTARATAKAKPKTTARATAKAKPKATVKREAGKRSRR